MDEIINFKLNLRKVDRNQCENRTKGLNFRRGVERHD